MTKQRNHKTRTVNRAYANRAGSAFGNVWDGLLRINLRASTLWQDFWGDDRILGQRNKRKPEEYEEPALQKLIAGGMYRPCKPWSAEALLGELRKLYGDESAAWRTVEQEQTLVAVASSVEQVVAILPTGAGKSLAFMLPFTLPDAGITVLIVPLVEIHGNLVQRLGQLQIEYIEWIPGERREAGLVLVGAQAACQADFRKYVDGLCARQRLDRIVVDECHLTVTSASYRSSLVDITGLRAIRTQFVYLTATLPPAMQAEFEERNYLYRHRRAYYTCSVSALAPLLICSLRRVGRAPLCASCHLSGSSQALRDLCGKRSRGCLDSSTSAKELGYACKCSV